MISWVVGRGGLLGRTVEDEFAQHGTVWHPEEPFHWLESDVISTEISDATAAFAKAVGSHDWQIAWCAGVGVVGSGPESLADETAVLSELLSGIARHLSTNALGAFFFASSAGGVYAGSSAPPFDEFSPVEPLSPYGSNKLEQESLARAFCEQTGVPVLIGRISNLYGPGQNLSKPQGLISQVCLRVVARQPLALYVSLDTIRDYLFAPDAARLISRAMDRLRSADGSSTAPRLVVKVIASQQPVTVSTILAQFRWITKRPVSVIVATSPAARHQARDLRLVSHVWPELDRHPTTTLSEGIRAVMSSMLASVAVGRFAPSAPLRR